MAVYIKGMRNLGLILKKKKKKNAENRNTLFQYYSLY
jgi:hypothetical protein